ncbi:hypothetical protein DOTSEDRAFT_24515 [Dothistroma septosporum NZE10]|uniref:Uncharacterized protein n=1 Tax=Dothistroma septosporum (strain NZE10 / CBS 128990) TaxID=675120 RepID=N1PLW4_DOTSN|nr:hypothetical protein DOTSEDRAFT_24515 [Dothistroma septosporum NZE10]
MSTKQSPLLAIPCEVRLQIYADVIASVTALDIKPPFKPTKTNKWWLRSFGDYSAPSLLLANRLMRAEALQLYHKFLLDHLVCFQDTIDKIDSAVNKFSLPPKENTFVRCERDAVEKDIRLVEGELDGQRAAQAEAAERSSM